MKAEGPWREVRMCFIVDTNKIGRGVEGFGEKWEASWNSLKVSILKTGGSISKRILFRSNPNIARIRKMKTGGHHEVICIIVGRFHS